MSNIKVNNIWNKHAFFWSHSVKITHNTTLVVCHLMCITINFTLLFLCFFSLLMYLDKFKRTLVLIDFKLS